MEMESACFDSSEHDNTRHRDVVKPPSAYGADAKPRLHVTVYELPNQYSHCCFWRVEHFSIYGMFPGPIHSECFVSRDAAERYLSLCAPDDIEHVRLSASVSRDGPFDLVATFSTTPPQREQWTSSVANGIEHDPLPHSPYRSNGDVNE